MKYSLEVLHREPVGKKTGKTLLFIHGVGHGAWCWEKYMDYFSEAGYDCYALSLRGHCGSKGHLLLNTFTIDDYVEDVYQTVQKLGEKPILVGHSMGGEIIQKYFLKYQDTISGAVLLASSPVGGMRIWPDVLSMVPVAPQFLLCVLAMYGLIRPPGLIKKALFLNGRLSEEEVARYAPNFCPESLLAMALPVFFHYKPANVNIPVLVLGSDADLFFPMRAQKRNAKAYNVEPVMLPNMCHDMMLDPEWEKGAEEILKFLQQRGV